MGNDEAQKQPDPKEAVDPDAIAEEDVSTILNADERESNADSTSVNFNTLVHQYGDRPDLLIKAIEEYDP